MYFESFQMDPELHPPQPQLNLFSGASHEPLWPDDDSDDSDFPCETLLLHSDADMYLLSKRSVHSSDMPEDFDTDSEEDDPGCVRDYSIRCQTEIAYYSRPGAPISDLRANALRLRLAQIGAPEQATHSNSSDSHKSESSKEEQDEEM